MTTKPVFTATHPRACSTAFERVFMTRRNSIQTVHEPFGDAFYFGPERMGSRFEDDEKAREESGFAESTFKTVLDRIESEAADGKRVFIKDITYYLVPPEEQKPHLAPSLLERTKSADGKTSISESSRSSTPDSAVYLDSPPKSPPFPYSTPTEPDNPTVVPREILEKFHFTFLIRHPKFAIPSYYRCCIPPLVERTGFTPFLPSEAGYEELRRLFDYCKDTGLVGPAVCGQESEGSNAPGQPEICVIDADDLLDDPEGIIRKYCQTVGLQFRPEMLEWDSDADHEFAKQEFEKWDGFHDDAINSRDLKPRKHKKVPKTDEQMYAEWVEKYGIDAADMIKQTVDDNVATYDYLKQFAIRL